MANRMAHSAIPKLRLRLPPANQADRHAQRPWDFRALFSLPPPSSEGYNGTQVLEGDVLEPKEDGNAFDEIS
jgi:hypothetical protein